MSALSASVTAGESGPVITLSGQTDIATAAGLRELITVQLSWGTRYLTIDAAGLSSADTAAVQVLVRAAKTLNERGGGLVLLRPRRAVARVLEVMGADQVITIRGEAGATSDLPTASMFGDPRLG